MARHVVTAADTAIALGSGSVPVLATPRLIAWLEAATVDAAVDLPDGATTVGTRVDVEHLVASPVGAAVTVEAAITVRDARSLTFDVAAYHDVGNGDVLIARGQVVRAVVDSERFVARSVPPLVIREALPEEWDAVVHLRIVSYATGYGLSDDEDGYKVVLRNVMAHAEHDTVIVALREGELVGTVTVVEPGGPFAEVARPGEAEFRFMAVAPVAWGSGVGRALIGEVLRRAGDRPVVCCVIEGNDPAEALYLRPFCYLGRASPPGPAPRTRRVLPVRGAPTAGRSGGPTGPARVHDRRIRSRSRRHGRRAPRTSPVLG